VSRSLTESVADVLVASWEQSSQQDSLIEWARVMAELCS
jgi:hypothetical protein